jgi:hypothetical protein
MPSGLRRASFSKVAPMEEFATGTRPCRRRRSISRAYSGDSSTEELLAAVLSTMRSFPAGAASSAATGSSSVMGVCTGRNGMVTVGLSAGPSRR